MEAYRITREIGIDAGHRVPQHGSKCRSLHGHRYTIQATCEGPLAQAGEETGMVLDFGFLKDEMMGEIDEPCDHALILWNQDPLIGILTGQEGCTKLYQVAFSPTAENLARHWFERLAPRVAARTGGRATLTNLRVLETPNCWADYPG
jgi:6-pyruvoyltetrahydropterin/6-carboxytetrahydropterin synthase